MTPLGLVDDQGRVFVAPGGTPAKWNAGLGYTATGQLCTTTTVSPSDRVQAGLRRSNTGLLVVGDGTLNSRPYVFDAGIPTDKQSALAGVVIRQMNVVPAATDPFVAGIRVGPRGGVYMSEIDIPLRLRRVIDDDEQ